MLDSHIASADIIKSQSIERLAPVDLPGRIEEYLDAHQASAYPWEKGQDSTRFGRLVLLPNKQVVQPSQVYPPTELSSTSSIAPGDAQFASFPSFLPLHWWILLLLPRLPWDGCQETHTSAWQLRVTMMQQWYKPGTCLPPIHELLYELWARSDASSLCFATHVL